MPTRRDEIKEHAIFDRVLKVLARDYADRFLELALPGIPIRGICSIKWGNVAEVSIPRGHNALWKARLR